MTDYLQALARQELAEFEATSNEILGVDNLSNILKDRVSIEILVELGKLPAERSERMSGAIRRLVAYACEVSPFVDNELWECFFHVHSSLAWIAEHGTNGLAEETAVPLLMNAREACLAVRFIDHFAREWMASARERHSAFKAAHGRTHASVPRKKLSANGRRGALEKHAPTEALKRWALQLAESLRRQPADAARHLVGRIPDELKDAAKDPERLIYLALLKKNKGVH